MWGFGGVTRPGNLLQFATLKNGPVEIVNFPIKHGDFHSYVNVYQRVTIKHDHQTHGFHHEKTKIYPMNHGYGRVGTRRQFEREHNDTSGLRLHCFHKTHLSKY